MTNNALLEEFARRIERAADQADQRARDANQAARDADHVARWIIGIMIAGIIAIMFQIDSIRTGQSALAAEIAAIRNDLERHISQ
ncbi:MAG: hypothetical protein OXQ29_19480 [Rhodospirillaceae bacterium]|nr:hypothetical protein [Rhodospirillaceae bacterium]